MSALTCQLIIGGEPVALTFPAAECVVPAGVNGRESLLLARGCALEGTAADEVSTGQPSLCTSPTVRRRSRPTS